LSEDLSALPTFNTALISRLEIAKRTLNSSTNAVPENGFIDNFYLK
jgi:hypothetical protein